MNSYGEQVYSNNEVAQLIDGLWWEHENGPATRRAAKVKIGLSSSADGFNTVWPLVVPALNIYVYMRSMHRYLHTNSTYK